MQAYALTLLGESGENGENGKNGSSEVVGWKEIRYKEAATLDFMRHLFPCAQFIVNIRRDTAAQGKSAFHTNETVEGLDEVNLMLTGWAESQPSGTVHVVTLNPKP